MAFSSNLTKGSSCEIIHNRVILANPVLWYPPPMSLWLPRNQHCFSAGPCCELDQTAGRKCQRRSSRLRAWNALSIFGVSRSLIKLYCFDFLCGTLFGHGNPSDLTVSQTAHALMRILRRRIVFSNPRYFSMSSRQCFSKWLSFSSSSSFWWSCWLELSWFLQSLKIAGSSWFSNIPSKSPTSLMSEAKQRIVKAPLEKPIRMISSPSV